MSLMAVFGHALSAVFAAKPGTGSHSVARGAARRIVMELYFEDCRIAKERRDKWLGLIDADVPAEKDPETPCPPSQTNRKDRA